MADFSVPRCIKPVDFGVSNFTQLHHFSDTNEVGYGVVSHLRLLNVTCTLYLHDGKSRVAPLKKTTLPRMELAVAVNCNWLLQLTDKMLKDELEQELLESGFYHCFEI